MKKEKIIKYTGKKLIVKFSVDRCTHVAECLRGAPEVFNASRKPWIEPDAADPDKLAEVIMRCPTGALHFVRTDGGPPEPIPEKNVITLVADGPIYLQGNIEVVSGDDEVLFKDTRLSLCRCGASQHRPLCDGLHAINGFKDDSTEQPAMTDPVENKTHSQKLLVTLQPNGPLILSGPCIIKNCDDQIVFQGNRTALCRCGASKNKPFCDGSHTKISFSSE